MRLVKCLALICPIGAVPGLAQEFPVPTYGVVGPEGSIHMPDGEFRATWPVLGTWTILDEGEVTGQHVVYTQPGVIEHYLETGTFPDGAVLIKELLEAEADEYSTGTAAYATDVTGWFVMVKDKQARFDGNDLWGLGWGWAYFDVGDRQTTTTSDYRFECKTCHVPAKQTDWIFLEGYPVLHTD
ncbi:cytochrome P460 family protein [uncultured Ruegeria sp.]|uniref:cytochrome P460 family protein n=1 Tax=uncultured Ruegeria sp. TaxID=259304 RepID=UPI002607A8F7|nr:cytochrome P460 family protein [uncultured Ruegeria sp.]